MNYEDELSPEEREAFESLPREKLPPAVLEERVVKSLQDAQLVKTPQRFWNKHGVTIAIAASLLFFFLGGIAMKLYLTPAPATAPKFMLVLNQNPAQAGISREAELKFAKEYGNWARELVRQ